ncbi:plasmid pRiA4b ORF-3 family protein [Blastococcus sp. PRF04-17]|uniref:plasmid pRiA4b ORF-3 family protein n=1 Tax=Blastococcus sp. PRF04-17 TaxID=2933797 RepID=UPI001FF3EB9A|nr:plasmid pRiA4b ORF-3 family protein [Blastococcus sp. PRF04-17]UOY01894.1 plasmid pRiA4b ORF-3 family protein [Blastococcus sp. PRF04-17]
MRHELVDLLDGLRGSRSAELRRVVSGAGLDGEPPPPEPDVVEPYRWFLARLGDGVKLTAAGYLPPALVGETMRTLGWDADWIGAATREDITRPVAELRDTARRLGLVRVHRGTLGPTTLGRRLAEDPTALWRHIAARLPLARAHPDRVAGLLWLLAVAAGRPHPERTVAEGLAVLGWLSSRTGQPLDETEAFYAVRDSTWTVFDRLGVLGTRRDRNQPPTPPAAALARASLLHEEPPAPGKVVPAVELTVTLRDVDPPVWRRLVVPEKATLRDLDGLLQAVMGWRGTHLSLFELDGRPYGDLEDDDELGDPRSVRVGSLADGTQFRWDYDFGDGWEHDVRVERHRTAEAPTCLAGANACPPEDSGGPHGYQRLRQVLADRLHPEHADALAWLGRPLEPERFDPAEATRRLRA